MSCRSCDSEERELPVASLGLRADRGLPAANKASNVEPLPVSAPVSLDTAKRAYLAFEAERSRLADSGDASTYAEFMGKPPAPEVILGRCYLSLSALVSESESGPLPADGRGRLYAWHWGAVGRAALMLYELDGNPSALDLVLSTADILLGRQNGHFGRADDFEKRVLPGWATLHNGQYFNEVTTAGLIVLPMLDALLLAARDPYVRKRIGAEREALWLTEIEAVLLQFDSTRRTEDGMTFYVEPFDRTNIEAWNHMSVYGAALLKFSALTGNKEAAERGEELLAFFSSILRKNKNGSYSWAYAPRAGERSAIGENIWKATASIELPIAAYQLGLSIDVKDIVAMARIVPENVLRAKGEADRSIEPGFHVALEKMTASRISMTAKWYMLACHDERVEELLSSYLSSRPKLLERGYFRASREAVLGAAYWQYLRTHGCPIL